MLNWTKTKGDPPEYVDGCACPCHDKITDDEVSKAAIDLTAMLQDLLA